MLPRGRFIMISFENLRGQAVDASISLLNILTDIASSIILCVLCSVCCLISKMVSSLGQVPAYCQVCEQFQVN